MRLDTVLKIILCLLKSISNENNKDRITQRNKNNTIIMVTVIHEHSVELSLLPESANILDLGARGFLFCDHMRSLGHKVTPVDIDEFPDKTYYRLAITGQDGRVGIHRNSDPQATRVKSGNDLLSMTIETFSNSVGIEVWHLIKMDVEGSEYDIIMGLKKPPAKQLSIEFHLHTQIYSHKEMRQMECKLTELGYKFVSHQMTSQHGCGMNYWDSLFIL